MSGFFQKIVKTGFLGPNLMPLTWVAPGDLPNES